jgi:hypothetical protein
MMKCIILQSNRRAAPISQENADLLVDAGRARLLKGNLYQVVDEVNEAASQTYETKVMVAAAPTKKPQQPQPKRGKV